MNGAKIKKAAADRSDVNGAFDNVANKATLTYGQHIQLHSLHDIGFSFTKKKKDGCSWCSRHPDKCQNSIYALI